MDNLYALAMQLGNNVYISFQICNMRYSVVVMGGIEYFLSRLLKDKIPQYLPYSDYYTFTNIYGLSTFGYGTPLCLNLVSKV